MEIIALGPERIVSLKTRTYYWYPSLFHVASRQLILYSSGHPTDEELVRISIHDDKSHKELAALDIPREHYEYISPSIDRREHATDIYIALCTVSDEYKPCKLIKISEKSTGNWSFIP